MKYIHTFESFLNESLNEGRKPFKGKTVNDLYRLVKNDDDALVFVKGKMYSILDPEEMKNDLSNKSTFVYDEEGSESEVNISDIEFIEFKK